MSGKRNRLTVLRPDSLGDLAFPDNNFTDTHEALHQLHDVMESIWERPDRIDEEWL